MPLRLFLLCSPVAALMAQAPALPKAPPVRGQSLVEITRAADDESVGHVSMFQHGATASRSGVLCVLVLRAKYAGPARTGAATGELELWRSDDRGASWRRAGVAPTRHESEGAFAVDGEQLVVAWSACDAGSFSDVYVQRFDLATDRWLATPTRLTEAKGAEDQYFTPDVARTANGTVVVVFGSHRSPPTPPWNGGWSTGMRVLRPGRDVWSPVQAVSPNFYGVGGQVLVRGDLVDVTYRTNPDWGASVHGLRSYDAAKDELQEPSPPIASSDDTDATSNLGVFCSDGRGGRALLHTRGATRPGRGKLALAYARGDEPFRVVDVAEDPPLQGGNENYTHFTLARGPGLQIWACYGKASEQFAKLWQCLLEDGVVVGAPRVVVDGEPDQFAVLGGVRTDGMACGMHAVVTSRTAKQPGGAVSVFGSWPARAVWER